MATLTQTPFSKVYDSFLSKVTDDMYLELTELDTYRMLQELLISAIPKFEFPRVDITAYEEDYIDDQGTYQGVESDDEEVIAIIYSGGSFSNSLSAEEINILATYMIVEWIGQQLASVENTRMKYSGSDFKFTSQANHMQKLLTIKKDYEREGFHLQRLYKRRMPDSNGVMRSTMHLIMAPYGTNIFAGYSSSTLTDNSGGSSSNSLTVEDAIEHCDENTAETKEYINNALTWGDISTDESEGD